MQHTKILNTAESFVSQPKSVEVLESDGVNVEQLYVIHSSENQSYVLKSVRPDHKDWVERSSRILTLASQSGFRWFPQPLKTELGDYTYKDENGKLWEMQQYVKGELVDQNELTSKQIESLAEVLATLHSLNFSSANIKYIKDLGEEVPYIEMYSTEYEGQMKEVVEKLKSHVEVPREDIKLLNEYIAKYLQVSEGIRRSLKNAGGESKFNKGLIHRDLNKGNILFDNKETIASLIDWDNLVYGNTLQDIAYLISQHLYNPNNREKSKTLIKFFIKKYQENLPLNKAEKEFFPYMVDILITRATRWWVKRYIEVITSKEESIETKNKIRGGFRKTLLNWLNNREKIVKDLSQVLD